MAVAINGSGVISGQTNYPAEMRNLLINGNFVINQKVVFGTVTLAAGAYGHDGWKAGTGGCTYSFAISGRNVIITITAGSLLQIVDPVEIDGGSYVASWVGTSLGRINGGTFSSSGVSVSSITSGGTLNIEFNSGTVTKVQVEAGTTPTEFERRRKNVELSLCQYYFCKSFRQSVAPGTNTGYDGGGEDVGSGTNAVGTSIVATVRFPVSMRLDQPVIVTYDRSGSQGGATNYVSTFNGTGGSFDNQPATIDNKSERGFKAYCASNSPTRIFFHWTANAQL